MKQRILRAELVEQCWLAQRAETLLAAALARPLVPPDSRLPATRSPNGGAVEFRATGDDPLVQRITEWKADVWAPIQTILQAGSVVSNTLYPSDPGGSESESAQDRELAERAALVMEGLLLPDLPNLRSKKARNAMIHVEDRAIRWLNSRLENDPDGRLGSWMWGRGPAPPNTFRWFNLDTWDLVVGGHACNLKAMVAEMRVVSEVVPVAMGIELVPISEASAD